MKKLGPYNGILKVEAGKTARINPCDEPGLKSFYLRVAKPIIRDVSIYNEAGKRIGHVGLPAGKFSKEVVDGMEIKVTFHTVGKDGSFDIASPNWPQHRIDLRDNPDARTVFSKGDVVDVNAYNVVHF